MRHIANSELNMRHQGLEDTAAVLLANAIQAQPAFSDLLRMDLSNNMLSDTGFAAIATVLQAKLLPNLAALNLSRNQLTAGSVKNSVRGMAKSLLNLDLSHNPIWCAPCSCWWRAIAWRALALLPHPAFLTSHLTPQPRCAQGRRRHSPVQHAQRERVQPAVCVDGWLRPIRPGVPGDRRHAARLHISQATGPQLERPRT